MAGVELFPGVWRAEKCGSLKSSAQDTVDRLRGYRGEGIAVPGSLIILGIWLLGFDFQEHLTRLDFFEFQPRWVRQIAARDGEPVPTFPRLPELKHHFDVSGSEEGEGLALPESVTLTLAGSTLATARVLGRGP